MLFFTCHMRVSCMTFMIFVYVDDKMMMFMMICDDDDNDCDDIRQAMFSLERYYNKIFMMILYVIMLTL